VGLQDRVNALPWHHELDLGDGVTTPGSVKLDVLRAQADVYFKDGVEGSSVLDIGCWDGFNSFEAKRRGASRVLATDHYVWHDGWGSRDSFELAREQLGLDVEVMDIDLPAISRASVGVFEVVLFCGVLYHLRDPLGGLQRASDVCQRMLVVETHLDARDVDRPAMVFYPGTTLGGDSSNWWGPNPACVVEMLHELGFQRVEHATHPMVETRGIFRAYRE
jgi:tRNA (mo5U34)-methyltransferase